ncbi:MazG nucleotide pyrophosphohydrolase domain-containing protein [Vibrio sp. MA40-2]|uniref:MazG nucleotide pyrophosphohydrolase domain-containing protein n=1 Tax=Vibrio sp. MA40-2 TaxID=3391828 RepID=UPI0039A58649
MEAFETLLKIAQRKAEFDKTSSWSNGAQTYIDEIKNEIDEVVEELPQGRVCYLEDELGDVLWDYLNMLVALEQEKGINVASVLQRACNKYEQRVSGIEAGKQWQEIKALQNVVLAEEQAKRINK